MISGLLVVASARFNRERLDFTYRKDGTIPRRWNWSRRDNSSRDTISRRRRRLWNGDRNFVACARVHEQQGIRATQNASDISRSSRPLTRSRSHRDYLRSPSLSLSLSLSLS